MARRTRRKSRKSKSSRRRRQSGGAGVAQHAGDFGAAEPAAAPEGGDVEEGMGHADNEQKGGKRKRKGKATKKGKKKKGKKKTRKRKLNPFFKLMLDAKKKGLPSFKYNGKTYKGRKHKRLGMIYKKA